MPLSDITARIHKAESNAGRPVGSTTLIAISKVQPLERVTSVLDQGQRVFGENRIQEASHRWLPLLKTYDGIDLHLVGPLQSNKLRPAVELFGTIHSLDREKLARKLADLAQERGACPNLFVQVNTGAEPQKAGVLPEALDAFIAACRGMDLVLEGLMCIPPVQEEASLHFALLRKMAARNGLTGLSMGMSADFEKAIALGATHIRVGSALFGDRVYA